MPITLPPAKNYASPLTAVPVRWNLPPREGPKMIVCEVVWANYPGNCVNFNLQNNAALEFSQIIALSIDNSQCGADVEFVFTDTTETLTIPAYSPKVIVPVFTNQTQFFVLVGIDAEVVEPTDVTSFSIHNSMPPPIAVPAGTGQNTAVVSGVDMGTASTQLVPTTVNGTLTEVQLNLAMNATNSGNGTWSLQDGTNKVILQGAISASSGNKYNLTLASLTNMNVRFTQGLKLVCTQTAVLGATINGNIFYRIP